VFLQTLRNNVQGVYSELITSLDVQSTQRDCVALCFLARQQPHCLAHVHSRKIVWRHSPQRQSEGPLTTERRHRRHRNQFICWPCQARKPLQQLSS
jgi:hypothetical protein